MDLVNNKFKLLGKFDMSKELGIDSIENYKKAIKIIELMAQEFKILGEYKDQKL